MDHDYFVISIFMNICTTCESGMTLERLNELFKGGNKKVYLVGILNESYGEKDILNLRRNLGIEFELFRADKILSNEWNNFKKQYSQRYLDFTIFTVNRELKIIDVLDRKIDNRKHFFTRLKELLDQKENEP